LLRKPTIVAMENNSQTVVAEAALGRSRAITLPIENATLTCTTRDMGSTRAKRLTASMSVVDNDEDEILVIEWLEANTISRPFGLGRATIGESRYEDERLLVVVCLAFHLFAVLLSPGGA
jgi:hypothetical protein